MSRSLFSTLAIVASLTGLAGCGSGSVTLTQREPLRISLPGNASTLSISGGATTAQFTITEVGYSGSFTATSSNTAVATVTPTTETATARTRKTDSGSPEAIFTVNAISNGTCTITVTDENGGQGSFSVTVSGLSGGPQPTASPAPTASPTPTPSPTPSPIPTPTPLPVIASPSAIAFTTIPATQAVTVSEGGYSGSFTALSMNTGVVTVTPASGTSFTVSAVAVGTTTITFTSGNGTVGTVDVSVTTTSGVISSTGRSAELAGTRK